MEAKKYIKTTDEINRMLAEEFGVSDKTVYNARYFATDSYTARMIRIRAQELGGKLMVEADAEESKEVAV